MRVLPLSPQISTPVRNIFILAGESDMSGRGLLSELPTFPNAHRVKVFSNAWEWVDGIEPVDNPAGQLDTVSLDATAGASPGMSFGNALAALRPSMEIALVPCARGGSRMTDWSRNLSRSTLYGSMIARAQEAAHTGPIKGVLWFQGKNGSEDEAEAEAWDENCRQLIADVRSDLGTPNLPFVVTVMNTMATEDAPYQDAIQAAQLDMDLPGTAVVDARDLPHDMDAARHLTTEGLALLGVRYAIAVNALLEA